MRVFFLSISGRKVQVLYRLLACEDFLVIFTIRDKLLNEGKEILPLERYRVYYDGPTSRRRRRLLIIF